MKSNITVILISAIAAVVVYVIIRLLGFESPVTIAGGAAGGLAGAIAATYAGKRKNTEPDI